MVLNRCRAAFPAESFELKIIKTTGDKLQTASLAQENQSLPKGLFTKELEVALLDGSADLAVHSLKDLPTELPPGLALGAVGGAREDVRDVLIYRAERPGTHLVGFPPGMTLSQLPSTASVATSSTRRKAQVRAQNPALQTPDIRGNVLTRMQKLLGNASIHATLLALAGLSRLGYKIGAGGEMLGPDVPEGLLATVLEPEVMLPCVGQGAIGIEIRADDHQTRKLCEHLNDADTLHSVTAERSFLAAMGGGCQSPVGAFARVIDGRLHMQVASFLSEPPRRAAGDADPADAFSLGQRLAAELR